MMDYPVAVLLKVPDESWFAIAAVTSMDRGNTGSVEDGPCDTPSPGANQAACDFRQGYFSIDEVANGLYNPLSGESNVVPWQRAPVPRVVCVAGCSGGSASTTVEVSFDPVRWYHDRRSVPSNNPTLATRNWLVSRDPTRAAGVGVVDLLRRWDGLARYAVEWAPLLLDPNGQLDFPNMPFTTAPDPNGIPLEGLTHPIDSDGEPAGLVQVYAQVPPDSVIRIRTSLGKPPETGVTTVDNCRTGRCGDLGLELAPTNRDSVALLGGALISEELRNAGVSREGSTFLLRWETTSELSVTGFEVLAVFGERARLVRTVGCAECSTGNGAGCEVRIPMREIRGPVKAFRIRMLGASGASVDLPLRSGGS